MRDIMFKYTITIKDLSEDKNNQFLVDKEEGQYLGHPDSVLLDNNQILVFYPKGHGKGPIVMKKI